MMAMPMLTWMVGTSHYNKVLYQTEVYEHITVWLWSPTVGQANIQKIHQSMILGIRRDSISWSTGDEKPPLTNCMTAALSASDSGRSENLHIPPYPVSRCPRNQIPCTLDTSYTLNTVRSRHLVPSRLCALEAVCSQHHVLSTP